MLKDLLMRGYQKDLPDFRDLLDIKDIKEKSGSFGGATFEYVADLTSTTSADPGSTKFRLNQTDLNTSTKLYISETTNVTNVYIETFIQTIESVTSDVKGFVKLSKKVILLSILFFK